MQVSENALRNAAAKIGGRIQAIRKAAGLTQAQLEEATEVADVGQIERGETNPTLLTLLRIAAALDVSLAEFTSGASGASDEIRLRILGMLVGQNLETQRKAVELIEVLVKPGQ